MSYNNFVHLRVHTTFSLSEGAIRIPELIALCKAEKMPAVAVTDSNNLFGALGFATACANAGVHPIIGCQITVDSNQDRRNGMGSQPDLDQIVLLVQDEAGYLNLLDLVSTAYLKTESGVEPHVSLDLVATRAGGLLCLTGGPVSPIGRRLLQDQRPACIGGPRSPQGGVQGPALHRSNAAWRRGRNRARTDADRPCL